MRQTRGHWIAFTILMTAAASGARAAAVQWGTDASGLWFDASKWSPAGIPRSVDDVIIDRPSADPLVTVASGNAVAASVQLRDRMLLSSSTLSASGVFSIGGELEFLDSTLYASRVTHTATSARITTTAGKNGAIEATELDAAIDVPATSNFTLVVNRFGPNAHVINNGRLNIYSNITGAALRQIDNRSYMVLGRGIDNRGEVFRVGSGASVVVYGQSNLELQGGRIEVDPGGSLELADMRLVDVTLQGRAFGRDVRIADHRLTLDGGHLDVSGITTLQNCEFTGTGTVSVGGYGWHLYEAGFITFRPGITVKTYRGMGNVTAKITNEGVIESTAIVGEITSLSADPSGFFLNKGTLRSPAGTAMGIHFTPLFTQAGVIDISAGRTIVSGTFDQQTLGTTIASGGRLVIRGTLDNAGKTFTAAPLTTGDVELDDSIIDGGVLRSTGGARFIASRLTTFLRPGTRLDGRLRIETTIDPEDDRFQIPTGSELSGIGTILASIDNDGTLVTGGLRIVGDYDQNATGMIRVDRNTTGTTLPVQVSGAAILEGVASLVADAAHRVLPNRSFRLLTAPSISGSLTPVNQTAQPGLILSISMTPTEVKLLTSALPGDANTDGDVDFDDLLLLAHSFNWSGQDWFRGDFNGNGKVGFEDLLLLAQNYGRTLNAFEMDHELHEQFERDYQFAFSIVPEPSLAMSLSLCLVRRKRD